MKNGTVDEGLQWEFQGRRNHKTEIVTNILGAGNGTSETLCIYKVCRHFIVTGSYKHSLYTPIPGHSNQICLEVIENNE